MVRGLIIGTLQVAVAAEVQMLLEMVMMVKTEVQVMMDFSVAIMSELDQVERLKEMEVKVVMEEGLIWLIRPLLIIFPQKEVLHMVVAVVVLQGIGIVQTTTMAVQVLMEQYGLHIRP